MEQTSPNSRRQQMCALIEKYLAGELTKQQFCQQGNVSRSTFYYWLKHYRRNHQNQDQLANEFIPVHFASKNPTIAQQPTFAIEYPNGVVVRLVGPVDVQLISQLVSVQVA